MASYIDPPDGVAVAAPTKRHILALSWPMTLKAIFLHGSVVIDGYLVSSLGESALAAMGLAAAAGGLCLGVIFAFSHALQIRSAQAFGSNDPVFQKSVLASGLWLSLCLGIAGVMAVLLFGRSFLAAMAPSAEIGAVAWTYLSIFVFVIIAEAFAQSIASYLNGCGRTRVPLYGYCLSVPINISLSIILIHGHLGMPALGVAGAAVGSAVAATVQALFLVVMVARTHGHLRRVAGWSRITAGATLRAHTAFALPIAATFISANFAAHVCTLIFANLSLQGFAALALIAPWNMVAGQLSMQWTQASGILVAQLLGQHAPETTLDRFLRNAWHGAFAAAALVALVFVGLCLNVANLYPDLQPETQAIVAGFLPILFAVQFLRASNAVCGNTLRASGDTVRVMHIFLVSQWGFRVPATAAAVLWFDLSAFWILSIVLWEEILKFPAFHLRLWSGAWKRAQIAA